MTNLILGLLERNCQIYLHKKFDSFPKSVNAASTSSAPVAAVKNKASFTKEGYIMRILNVKGRGAGAPVYLVASKDKKYSSWTTQSGLQ